MDASCRQMLVYKHECILGVLFGMLIWKFLFEVTTFEAKTTKKDLKLKD